MHWINHYPVDGVVCFVSTYPLESDLPSGLRYPAFEQLGPVPSSAQATCFLAQEATWDLAAGAMSTLRGFSGLAVV